MHTPVHAKNALKLDISSGAFFATRSCCTDRKPLWAILSLELNWTFPVKAWWVKDSLETHDLTTLSFAYAVSCESIWIGMTYAALLWLRLRH